MAGHLSIHRVLRICVNFGIDAYDASIFGGRLVDIVTRAASPRRSPSRLRRGFKVVFIHGLDGGGYQVLPSLGDLHGVVGIAFLCKIFFGIFETVLEYFCILHGALRITGCDVWFKVLDRFVQIAHQIVIVIVQIDFAMFGICGAAQYRRGCRKKNGQFTNH
jgi:hypothetical protein